VLQRAANHHRDSVANARQRAEKPRREKLQLLILSDFVILSEAHSEDFRIRVMTTE